LKVSSGPLFF